MGTVRYRCVSTTNAPFTFLPSHAAIRTDRSLLDCVVVCIVPPRILRPPSAGLTDVVNRRSLTSQLRCCTDSKTFAGEEGSGMRSSEGVSEIGEELFHAKRNISIATEQFLPSVSDTLPTNHPPPIQLDCNWRGDVNFFSLSQLIRLVNMKCDCEMMRYRLLLIECVRNADRCCCRRCFIEVDLLHRDAPVAMRIRTEDFSRSTGRRGA